MFARATAHYLYNVLWCRFNAPQRMTKQRNKILINHNSKVEVPINGVLFAVINFKIMSFQFLYTTNEMNTDKLAEHLFELLNSGETEHPKISKSNIDDLVQNILPGTHEMNLTGLIDELWELIEPARSKEYISEKDTVEEAVKDFFDISEHDFALDLWDVDEEVKNMDTGEFINITHFKEWDF